MRGFAASVGSTGALAVGLLLFCNSFLFSVDLVLSYSPPPPPPNSSASSALHTLGASGGVQTTKATTTTTTTTTLLSSSITTTKTKTKTTDWSVLDRLLDEEIALGSFPGAVAGISYKGHVVHLAARGHFTYGLPAPASGGTDPPMTLDSLFDMASLTKVLATTTSVMILYQRGLVSLTDNIAAPHLLGPSFAVHNKGAITIKNLLLHNAGFPPDPVPGYWRPAFGCPESSKVDPLERFSCQAQIYQGVLNQTLDTPPGTRYVYSDLSMITMMYVVGAVVRAHDLVPRDSLRADCVAGSAGGASAPAATQCYYEAFVREHVAATAGMVSSGFLPAQKNWAHCPPTWNDTDGYAPGPGYRHRVVQGQVSDQNSYALGGVAGHAGFFSNVGDVLRLLQRLMYAASDDAWVNSTTLRTFVHIVNATQSARALGWDTNAPVNTYKGCGNLSATTYTHTGYTGTQACNDIDRQLITVLLTNRVYPKADDASEHRIHLARQRFNNAVRALVDG